MAQEQTSQPRTSRWIKGILFVSLALNLLVFGTVVGHVFSDGPQRSSSKRSVPDTVMPYTRALSESQRRALGRTLRDTLQQRRRPPGPMVEDYRAAALLLRSDPFDRDARVELLQSQGSRAEMRREAGQDVLVQFLSDLSPADRAAYADRLESQITRMQNWRKSRDKD